MKNLTVSAFLIGIAAAGSYAHAQFVDDNVVSDGAYNTGLGTNVLTTLTTTQDPNCNYLSITGQGTGTPTCSGNSALGDGAMQSLTTAYWNTAVGAQALNSLTTGMANVAVGTQALFGSNGAQNTALGAGTLLQAQSSNNTAVGAYSLALLNSGGENTAVGTAALQGGFSVEGSSGSNNTAVGYEAMLNFVAASNNTAVGVNALSNDSNGNDNVALGYQALMVSQGGNNTGTGYDALLSNTTGLGNTAVGAQTLNDNTTGNYNTASGYEAMFDNTTGAQNSAQGLYALHNNAKGNFNAAQGAYALYSNTSGSSNVALGYKAGFYPTAGANNIHINNLGVAGDTDVIKIGTQGTQTKTSIAGIYSTSPMTGGSVVVVNSAGLLGVQAVSSERFKSDIVTMGENTARLGQLRPVTFHYKSDPLGPVQYGLVAEEVAKVYPELVTRDEHGDVNGVRYDELAPILLNEMKQQNRMLTEQNQKLAAELHELQAAVQALQASQKN